MTFMKKHKFRMLEELLVVKTPRRFPGEELTSFGNDIKRHMYFERKARKGRNPIRDAFVHVLFRLGLSDRDSPVMEYDENLPEILLKCDLYGVKYKDCEKFVNKWIDRMLSGELCSIEIKIG